MPQIEQLASTYASQIFWLLIIFGLTYFVVGRGMVPKIESTVQKRDTQIAEDLAAAERAREEADAVEDRWRAKMAEARTAAQAETNKAKEASAADATARVRAADAELDAKLEAAEAEIAKAKAEALTSLETVAAEAARDIVAKLSGVEVSEAVAEQKVREALAHG